MDDDVQVLHPLEKVEEEEEENRSSQPTSFYYLSILFFLILISLTVLAAVAFVLVVRPKKPVFAMEAIHLSSINLNVSSNKQIIYLPPFTASMSFATRNPNNFGIRYGYTELDVVYSDNPVGVIRVPRFYQPPRNDGNNVSFTIHASIYEQLLNLTQLVVNIGLMHTNKTSSEELDKERSSSLMEIQVVGCVEVRMKIVNFLPLPEIKIAMDCKIWVDDEHGLLSVYKGFASMKKHKGTLLSSLPHISQKCSFSLCL